MIPLESDLAQCTCSGPQGECCWTWSHPTKVLSACRICLRGTWWMAENGHFARLSNSPEQGCTRAAILLSTSLCGAPQWPDGLHPETETQNLPLPMFCEKLCPHAYIFFNTRTIKVFFLNSDVPFSWREALPNGQEPAFYLKRVFAKWRHGHMGLWLSVESQVPSQSVSPSV